jgi:mycofactocin system glycosyltransferase
MRRAAHASPCASRSPGRGEADAPLPIGFGVELDPDARELAPGLWWGGQPGRVLRLTAGGRTAWEQLRGGPVRTRAEGLLARRLTDAGIAHPLPPQPPPAPDLTVIVPVHDRVAAFDRCLAGLGTAFPVVAVDDASADEFGVRAVAAGHGARVLRLPDNRGPGGARNAGVQQVTTELVAFVDSDTVPDAAALVALAGQLADPLVVAAAPRIVPVGPGGYRARRSPLDLGAKPGRVTRYGRVSYVPSAVLVCRRAALLDPTLRVGEDVDLIWRLVERGFRVRYDPAVRVAHEEPATWPAILARRYRYGTSAAPLGQRHPESVAPLLISPWLGATVVALLARRPAPAAAAFAGAWCSQARALRQADVPRAGLTAALADGVRQTWLGAGRWATQFAAPLLVALAVRGRRGTRLAALSLLLGPALSDWCVGPRGDPVRYTVAHLADDVAYGTGVLAGCARLRTLQPLRPRLINRRRQWPTRGSNR